MSWWWIVVIVAVVLMLAWLYSLAKRLNRLHIRTDAARHSLEAALDRRAAVAAALIPEAADAAHEAQDISCEYGSFAGRARAEKALKSLIEASHQAENPELVAAQTRVELATRFYNEAVADTRAVQLLPAARFFRLGGRAQVPQFYEPVL